MDETLCPVESCGSHELSTVPRPAAGSSQYSSRWTGVTPAQTVKKPSSGSGTGVCSGTLVPNPTVLCFAAECKHKAINLNKLIWIPGRRKSDMRLGPILTQRGSSTVSTQLYILLLTRAREIRHKGSKPDSPSSGLGRSTYRPHKLIVVISPFYLSTTEALSLQART
ncbi:hypothetical protein RRG08_055723 [Elysia crispata]|uniref:Uncharacterized protein n=1 Tax=Elysia crispata TaxID=231223 RepID=A0AAE1E764_9GAST|nr:hypothetical protein RRG08_055723 [Elysia crispata]